MINLKQHPKAQAKFNTFIETLLRVWVEQAVGEGMEENEISAEYIKTAAETMILSNPRLLYDFLDENHVYMQPILLEQLNPDNGWGYEISSVAGMADEIENYKTRKNAEQAGFNQALKILEELL